MSLLRDFWYVVAEGHELDRGQVLARQVLDEWLVVWRDAQGRPVVAQDRCMHRAGRLSHGRNVGGCVQCPYHGWTYDGAGELVAVPAEGESFKKIGDRRLRTYASREQDGFVYVRLNDAPTLDVAPFRMPHYGEPGYQTVRVQNRMKNNVTNCVENFIDVPHTVYVHPGIFRTARGQRIEATVVRSQGSVVATYRNETDNLGWFARLLNPRAVKIEHSDAFYMPNVTHVVYRVGPRRHFLITSQSVPISDDETLVYTDLTFDFGPLSWFVRPIVRWQGQRVIDQDIVALGRQMEVIQKYGAEFHNSPVDVIHVLVESIRGELSRGRDPRELPDRAKDIEFWV
ncbi:MAG TPA: aromatic ring-hydroxylating dioxygenase subunit alpha [Myxococcota bacterium]|nr:aromatic ring-hydroxylating dioxygenase subunit alpha [Myxococcota bacterium]